MEMRLCFTVFFSITLFPTVFSSSSWYFGRDPPNRWSVGGIWPLPFEISYGPDNRTISQSGVTINLGEMEDCDILSNMSDTYLNRWLFPFPVAANTEGVNNFSITIVVNESCPSGPPADGDSEEYSLVVNQSGALLNAQTVWGALRGMESFSQLVFYKEDSNEYQVRTVNVSDKPRFQIRGLMMDSSRHFPSTNVIKRQLDIMAMNKMNLLHMHLTDSESFPYASVRFPKLQQYGAYSPRHVYSRQNMSDIIAHARLRGIRVVPEFDLPGHTGSWRGREGFLTECFDENGQNTNLPNIMDPSNEANFQFIADLLEEVTQTYPEQFLHLGGDGTSDYVLDCWLRNPNVSLFMAEQGFGNDTLSLENYFFEKLYKIVSDLKIKRQPIYGEQVFENNIRDPNSIFHIWSGQSHEEVYSQVQNITAANYRVIVSSCWYLNYIKYGADWRDHINGTASINSRYYYCDPTNFNGTDAQKALVLGGIAAIWGEFIDNTNLEATLWPRASAVAERLWSPAETTQNAEDAWPRMHELTCRLVSRGYRIQPVNYPDYCPFEFDEGLPY